MSPFAKRGLKLVDVTSHGRISTLARTIGGGGEPSPEPGPVVQLEAYIASGADDAEETIHGSAPQDNASSDLELYQDGGQTQHIGLRFQNIQIPPGAAIQSAYIEFAVDEPGGPSDLKLRMYGQAADDVPSGFAHDMDGSNPGDISGRPRTTSLRDWSPLGWDSTHGRHTTPDIAHIIQEIVDRAGWQSGNSLAILIEPHPDELADGIPADYSGRAVVAESYEGAANHGDATLAPRLVIEYQEGGDGGGTDNRTASILWMDYHDFAYQNPGYSGNPYDIVATATFTHETEPSITTEMFYNGGSEWILRFRGSALGTWSFTTNSNEAALDGLTGTVEVEPANTYRLGPVEINGQDLIRRYNNGSGITVLQPFAYDVDRSFDQMGDLSSDPSTRASQIQSIFDEVESAGMDGVMCYTYNNLLSFGNPLYSQHNSGSPDRLSFAIIEELLEEAKARDMYLHIWFWGDEADNETPIGLSGGINGVVDQRVQRYIAARLGPIAGWIANYGYDLGEWVDESEVRVWGSYMHSHMGWDHALMAREQLDSSLSEPVFDLGSNKLDIYSNDDRPALDGVNFYDNATTRLNEYGNFPVMFERRFQHNRDNVWDAETTRRSMWQFSIAGVGAIYGVRDEGDYSSAERARFRTHREFWSNRHFTPRIQVPGISSEYALRSTGAQRYVVYQENTDVVSLPLADLSDSRPAVAVDTVSQTYEEISLGTLDPGNQSWTAPYSSDWAIAVGAGEDGSGGGGDGGDGGTGGGGGETDWSFLGNENFSTTDLDDTQADSNGRTLRDYHNVLSGTIGIGYYDSDFNSSSLRPSNRQGNMHVTDLLTAGLRGFGDLKFLDEALRLIDFKKNHWSTDGSGYRYWSDEYDQELDVPLLAGLIGRVAYAAHINRGLTSPGGWNYGTEADYWFDWLFNDYQPRWSQIEGNEGQIPFMDKFQQHTVINDIASLYYMGLYLGSGSRTVLGTTFAGSDYLNAARSRWSHKLASDSVCSDGHNGRNVRMWSHIVRSEADADSSSANGLQYTTYVRYEVSALIDLLLEEFAGTLDDNHITEIANAFSDFVVGTPGQLELESSIGGTLSLGDSRCGIPWDDFRDRLQNADQRWQDSSFAFMEGFDSRGRIEQAGYEYFDDNPGLRDQMSCYPAGRAFTLMYHEGLAPGGGGGGSSTLTEFDVLTGQLGTTDYPNSSPAFPSAEGYGRNTKGARAPGTAIDIYYVTNLNNSGTGSLRAALEATGPRIVVILVSGWIRLQEGITIPEGNLTVYGNWVKSGYQGHAVRMYRTTAWGSERQPCIQSGENSEIIMRFVRAYRAPHPDFVSAGHTESSGDGIVIADNHDVGALNAILDHVNMAFTTDDSGGLWGYRDGSLQHAFFGDAIGGMHDKGGGGHDYGPIISTRGNETMHHCFFTRINERTPRVSSRDNSHVDCYNLYAYNTNPGHQFATSGQNQQIHFVDSWNEEGPYTAVMNKPYWAKFLEDGDPMFSIYIARCRGYRINGTTINAMWDGQTSYAYSGNISEGNIRSNSPLFTPPDRLVHNVDNELRDFIRNYVGFSWVIDPDTGLLVDVRDSYHKLRIDESVSGTGPNDTIDGGEVEGTIPTLDEWTPPGATYADQATWFETNYFEPWATAQGFTGTPTNIVTVNGQQYTEIECYMMSLIPDFPSL